MNSLLHLLESSPNLIRGEVARILGSLFSETMRQETGVKALQAFMTMRSLRAIMNMLRVRSTFDAALPLFAILTESSDPLILNVLRKNRSKLITLIDECSAGRHSSEYSPIIDRLYSLQRSEESIEP